MSHSNGKPCRSVASVFSPKEYHHSA